MLKKKLKNGFLDNDIMLEVYRIKKENSKLYNIIEKMNKLFYSIEENYEKIRPTNVDVYVRTTFSQIHMSAQSYVILLERGLYDDSQVILRSMYDKITKCLYAIKYDSIEEITQESIRKTISLYEYIEKNELYNYISKDKLNEFMNAMKESQKKDKQGKPVKMPHITDLCNDLDIKEAYIHYSLLSGYVHNSIGVIGNKVIENGLDILINQNIDHGDFKNEIIKMIICMKFIIDPICEYLNLGEQSDKFNELVNMTLKIS